MAHVRQQIREAAATAVAGLATTGARVFQSRIRPLAESELPCLRIDTDDEVIAEMSPVAGGPMARELRLTVTGLALATSNLDDTLDTIAAEVEVVMLATSQTLGGKAKAIQLRGLSVEIDDSLQKPVGAIRMEFAITYITAKGSPSTAL